MKPLSAKLLAIVLLATGFIAGMFFSNFFTKQKLAVEKEQLNFLIELHDFQRKRSKEAYVASDTILNKIFRLIESDSTLSPKGRDSKDPIKRLLLESYDCIGGNMQVIDNYAHVYVEDSVFLKRYFKLEQ